MSNIDKQAQRMRNYLNTAVISGVKLLHLTTDELSGLLDELEKEKGYASAFEAEKWLYHGLAESEGERADRAEKRAEAAEKRMAELESDKTRMMDALHAAVALNSAGISLNDFDECVLRLHEWGALPDYCIALYVDFIHGYVSENKLLDFGYVTDNGAFSLRQAENRIAEQPSQKRLIGWRASDYTDETSDPELAKNWAAAIGVLPIFEGDVNTKLSAAGIGKGE